jgi:uncharacterized protein (DUF427 family)
MRAIWNGTVIARSDATVVEGNHHLRAESILAEHFGDSSTHSNCPRKGEASQESIVVEGERNIDAACYHPEPLDAAAEIRGHYALWKGAAVSD